MKNRDEESREDFARKVLETFDAFEHKISRSRTRAEFQARQERFNEYVDMLREKNPNSLFGSPNQETVHVDPIDVSLNNKIAAVKNMIVTTATMIDRAERATGIDPRANKYQGSENLNSAEFLATLKKCTDEVSQAMETCFPDPNTWAVSSEANFQAFLNATNQLQWLRFLPKHAAVLLEVQSNSANREDEQAIINRAADVGSMASISLSIIEEARQEAIRQEVEKESPEEVTRKALEVFDVFEQEIRQSQTRAELKDHKEDFNEYLKRLKQQNPKSLFDPINKSLNSKITAVEQTIDTTTTKIYRAERAMGIGVPTPLANKYQGSENLNSAEFLVALKNCTDEVSQAMKNCFSDPKTGVASSEANFQAFVNATNSLEWLRSLPNHAAVVHEVQSNLLDHDAKMVIISKAAEVEIKASNLLSRVEFDRDNPSPSADKNPGPYKG